MRKAKILVKDAISGLSGVDSDSAHCCVTSPPYWGLRDYGEDDQIGLEATPEEYVGRLVEVFREVRRVLRSDGTLWLNLGDSYATRRGTVCPDELKPGDMVGIPWQVVFALRADGWWLRSAPVWAKPNPMPESVSGWRWERCRVRPAVGAPSSTPDVETEATPCPGCDKCSPHDGLILRRGSWRPTSSYEFVFLLAPSADYFCDQEAVREASDPRQEAHNLRYAREYDNEERIAGGQPGNVNNAGIHSRPGPGGRNPRDVWMIATRPFPGAHFAVFPPELPERCIRAGTAERTCAECGAPWAPVVERGGPAQKTTDHRPTCACDAGHTPATVLDPFAGAGTTGLVALRMGRHFVGCELNPEYARMAADRIRDDAPLLNEVGVVA